MDLLKGCIITSLTVALPFLLMRTCRLSFGMRLFLQPFFLSTTYQRLSLNLFLHLRSCLTPNRPIHFSAPFIVHVGQICICIILRSLPSVLSNVPSLAIVCTIKGTSVWMCPPVRSIFLGMWSSMQLCFHSPPFIQMLVCISGQKFIFFTR
jgi:hypothetical protein